MANEAKKTYRTESGRVLTDADIEAMADEAEQGYGVTTLGFVTHGDGSEITLSGSGLGDL
ncbi:MAG: hypothetical protein ACYCO3_13330 [Mycobacteriales bacterium]